MTGNDGRWWAENWPEVVEEDADTVTRLEGFIAIESATCSSPIPCTP
jgi:hypothetical protein